MKHKIRVGVMFEFEVDDAGDPRLVPYLINGQIRENIEMNLPEDIAMRVLITEVDGERVENKYE